MSADGPGRDVGVRTLEGGALTAALDAMARLRITVFRAYPYLYDGDAGYERRYLASYAESAGAVIVGAFDGDALVGAATAAPMEDHAAEFAEPFRARGLDIGRVMYFGESVLLPEYRGRGLGHAFFDAREAAARRLGRQAAAFCAVVRPDDHLAKPADYAPLDPFWRKRGYAPMDGVIARFSWKDLGEPGETEKPLQFWWRAL